MTANVGMAQVNSTVYLGTGAWVGQDQPKGLSGVAAGCEVYYGSAARKAIIARLPSFPEAWSLAGRVCDFFGDDLFYREAGVFPSSFYEIKLGGRPTELRYGRIGLQLGTRRTVEALCHELLHLDLAVRGFPLPVEALVPVELAFHARHLLAMQAIAANLLGHEAIFRRYLELGLDGRYFVSPSCAFPDYEALAAGVSDPATYSKALGYPWWCLEYLRHLLSSRYGADEGSVEGARAALLWGSSLHPEMADGARAMGALLRPDLLSHASALPEVTHRLMEIMKLPRYTKWVVLTGGSRVCARINAQRRAVSNSGAVIVSDY